MNGKGVDHENFRYSRFLQRLAERLDNQWAYAQTSIKDDIAVGQVEYNDDGERLPIEPEISYYGMIAAFETLGGEWKRSSDGKHWLITDGRGRDRTAG